MPGIAMDGSEDLPNDNTPAVKGDPITRCPTCYELGVRQDKSFERRTYCIAGHSWPHALGLLAKPFGFAEPNMYGLCPTCNEPGVLRARDMEGTTHCKAGHTWKAHPLKLEQKPVDPKQNQLYDTGNLIQIIKQKVEASAKNAREDAGYSGSWTDGGASRMEEKLKHWLDGIRFAQTGETDIYKAIVKDFKDTQDPEYQAWLRLNQKFGNKSQ